MNLAQLTYEVFGSFDDPYIQFEAARISALRAYEQFQLLFYKDIGPNGPQMYRSWRSYSTTFP
jgi:hypothetical protein